LDLAATAQARTPAQADVRILIGDCRDRLRELPDRSVHCVLTSPPYWGLRDYGAEGQLGLEAAPEAYVESLVEVFREVRRVLRDDGTLWLVLGDCFAGNGGSARGGAGRPAESSQAYAKWRRAWGGLKPKDLVGIPWRVAFALRADGWWLRSDVVWAKKNPMPESVRDRPTRAHEYVFLLAKSRRYFYDADAVQEPFAEATVKRLRQASFDRQSGGAKDGLNPNRSARRALVNLKGRAMPPQLEDRPHKAPGRNLRSVWHLGTQPFKGAHFATFPTRLVEPCIRAGTSEAGCCPSCGTPWTRVIERERRRNIVKTGQKHDGTYYRSNPGGGVGNDRRHRQDLGWRPSCSCPRHEPAPCTVLDPFAGAGTTGLVAGRLGREALLIELNPEYAAMARERLAADGIEASLE